jgi:hypothetical protein
MVVCMKSMKEITKDSTQAQLVSGFYSETDVMVLIDALLARSSLKRETDGKINEHSKILAPKRTILESGNVDSTEVNHLASEISTMQHDQQILVPVIIPNQTHWVTLQITCFIDNSIVLRCYDSIGRQHNQEMSILRNLLENKLQRTVKNKESPTPIIQQNDTYCGGYTARLIANLALSQQPEYTNINIWNCNNLKDKELREQDLLIINEMRPTDYQKFGSPDLLSESECVSQAEKGSQQRIEILQNKKIQITEKIKTSNQEQRRELKETLALIHNESNKLPANDYQAKDFLSILRRHKLDRTILKEFIFRLDAQNELIRDTDGDSMIQDDLEIGQIHDLLAFTLQLVSSQCEVARIGDVNRDASAKSGKIEIKNTKPANPYINEKTKQVDLPTEKAAGGKGRKTVNQVPLLTPPQLKSETSDDEYNDNSVSHIKHEEEFKDGKILYYANKAGLLPIDFSQDQDLLLPIGSGIDKKEYVYNHQRNNLKCNDSSGSRYYNNEGDKKREKLLLRYELKKLYLNEKKKDFAEKLQKGDFNDDSLIVKDDSSQTKSLEEKIKSIDQIIDILDEHNPNYGYSFAGQVNVFIKCLEDLNNFSDELNKTELYTQVMSFFKDKASIVLDDNEKRQHQFIRKCINLLQSKNFTMESTELKNSPEYRELTRAKAEDFFGGLIRDVKHKTLSIRKEQIEKELSKTKLIEQEIRKKQEEIRKTKGEFSEEDQISEKDEEKYKRLLKAQRVKTNNNYREGFARTKDVTEEDALKRRIRHSNYEIVSEEKDVEDIRQIINKEHTRIKSKEEYIANKRQEALDLREDRIPTLEEERDLLPIIITGLERKLKTLNTETKECETSQKETEREINRIERDNDQVALRIKSDYKKLGTLLNEIEKLKEEIKELKNAKVAVRGEEIESFKDNIFEKAGGQKKGESENGFVNHVDCKPDIPLGTNTGHCLYRSATDSAVDFALNQIEAQVPELDEAALFDCLAAYTHSAAGGKGKHASHLRDASQSVFAQYRDVEKRIQKREDEYQRRITDTQKTQQNKEQERDASSKKIVDEENKLNDENIKLSKKEREKKAIVCQGNNDLQVTFIDNSIGKLQEQQSFISDEIDNQEQEISKLILDIADKRGEINDLETEIYKEGEYNQLLALSEARWRYSQYEKIVTNIDDLEEQHRIQERLLREKSTIDEKLEKNELDKQRLNDELGTKNEDIKKISERIDELIIQKNKLIETRSYYETESHERLVNTIEICRREISKIEGQQKSEIEKMNKDRASIIKREVYKKLDLKQKGTTKSDGNDPEEIGTENQLYKKRRHKNCQDVFEKENQGCKYFDAIDLIIKRLLESKSNEEIFAELEGKGDHYKNHVLGTHKPDIKDTIQIIRDKIGEFNNRLEEIKAEHERTQTPIKQLINTTKTTLLDKKKLDGVLSVKKLVSVTPEKYAQNVQDNLDVGIDCVVIDEKIYTYKSKNLGMTIDEFIAEITSGQQLTIDDKHLIKQKALEFLRYSKDIPLEAVLLQKKDTEQEAFYKILVQYFDKRYLKKKLEIIEQINGQTAMEAEVRDIRREIARIDKENEKLLRIKSDLEDNSSLNTREIERLKSTSQVLDTLKIIEGENTDFRRIKVVYTELLDHAKQDSNQVTENIKLYRQQIKDLKSISKSVDCSQDSLFEIKPRILKNRFKIGLKSTEQKHRDCDDVCDFFQRVASLIDDTIEAIQLGSINLRVPEYKVFKKNQDILIEKLKIKDDHSNRHEQALRRVILYVAEEYGQAREKAQIKHNNEIKELEWKIAKLDSEKEVSNQILIPELQKRIAEIDSFFVFRKDISFIGKNSGSDDITQKELVEYQEEKFKDLFKSQVNDLIIIFERLNLIYESEDNKDLPKAIPSQGFVNQFIFLGLSGIQYIREKLPGKTTSITKETSPIIQCIHHVFKDYYDDLNINPSLIPQLIRKLRQELSEDNPESKIKSLIKKKTTQTGGIEYILKKISWIFHQDQQAYNQKLDPEKIYYQILLEENQAKEKIEAKSLEILQEELLALEARKQELSMQDTSLFRDELENIDTGIRCIENTKEVADLRKRIEELDDSRSNKDDYYAFEMDSRRICVRLLNKYPVEKSAEIKEIDRIRNYLTEQNLKLLEKRVIKERYEHELKEEIAKNFKAGFIEIQRKLLVKGISLYGCDKFENGESLNTINGFISVIIASLIGEESLYQVGGINEVSKRIEGWARKIRSQYNNNFVLSQELCENNIKFIIDAINTEFKSDRLFISQINIIKNKQHKKILFEHDSPGQIITLLIHKGQYFALVPQDKIKIYKLDEQIDLNIKITNILAVLQTEEGLFKYLCQKRLQDGLTETLEQSKELSEFYKEEKKNLAKILSLKDFNALFCSSLELTDDLDSEGVFLFAYLAYLEKLENTIEKDEPQDKTARLKIVKNLYDKALFRLIKEEQQRRRKKNIAQSQESREELYLKELIKQREEELEVLLQEIRSAEENIEKDQNLVSSLLLEKESTRDRYQEKIEQLSKIAVDLKEKLRSLQEKIRELNKNEKDNQEDVKKVQEEIVRLEAELAQIEEEIRQKEIDKELLEREIRELKNQKQELGGDLKRVEAEKARKTQEEAEKRQEIDVAKDIVQLIQNLQSILADSKLQPKKEEIKKCAYESNDLQRLLENLRVKLEELPTTDGTNFWQLLIKDVNYEQLKSYLNSDKRTAGELQRDLVSRLRAVIRDSVSIECEIVQEFVKDKPINRFKVLATNANYQDIHSKVKDCVEREIQSTDASRGLGFQKDGLYSTDYGITGIQDLPNALRMLIERRIELHYKSEEVDSKKNAKFAEAAKIINELQINYQDVVRCYIDEIEIIVSGKFILNNSPSYSGIDLTINAVDMECVGENLTLDTSGEDGEKFCQRASNGSVKRIDSDKPRGNRGYDGYDGDHGGHAGNIIIKVKNTIINLEALKIKANGGNGGEGQLGGDGDEGSKGVDGKDGEAADTQGFGGGQTTIGFGSPGTPGGDGGAAGYTGRPGMGGKAGVIDIEHKVGKITTGEIKPGQEADNVLDKSKPSGGKGGEPGLYGMDQIKDKKNLFVKTRTLNTVIDRAALIKKYPKFRDQITAEENVTSTNLGGVAIATVPILGILAVPAFVIGAFWDDRISFEEVHNPTEYRDMDRNRKDKRGRKNEEEAKLRSDYRVLQQDKREAINIDSLHAKLNAKKNEVKEISGIELHQENINDLLVEQEELLGDIEKCIQEADNIKSDMENVALAIDAKSLELDKMLEEIASLRSNKLTIDNERIGRINQVIRAITKSQDLRDKKLGLNLDVEQTLARLEKYNSLGEEFCGNKEDLIKIIDEYLDAVRMRLKRSRNNLKFLKKNFADRKSDIKSLSKKIEDLRQERLSQIVTEAEIDEEIEEEIETQHVEEITHLVDLEDREVHVKAKYNNRQQISEEPYITTKYLFDSEKIPESILDIKEILDQSVRHYRSGMIDDSRVQSIIEKISIKTEQATLVAKDLAEIINTYQKEIKKIRIGNKINSLSSIKRNLLLDHLKQISTRLENNHLANFNGDIAVKDFVLEMLKLIDGNKEKESVIAEKIRIRFDGQYLLGHDRLKDDIDSLIALIDDMKTFYLEKCAINFSKELTSQTQCEKLMLDYNKQPNLKNLYDLVKLFKTYQLNITSGVQRGQYNFQSIEWFILISLENIRYHAILVIDDIIKNVSKHNEKDIVSKQDLYAIITVIINDIKNIPGITTANTELLDQIMNIIKQFRITVKNLKDGRKSKKEVNKIIKLLELVTKKLIRYIDCDNDSSQDIKAIATNYIELLTTDLENLEDVDEQIAIKEERARNTNRMQEIDKEALLSSDTQSLPVIIKHQGDISKLYLRQSSSKYWMDYNEIAIDHLLTLRLQQIVSSGIGTFYGLDIIKPNIIVFTDDRDLMLQIQLLSLSKEINAIYANNNVNNQIILAPLLLPETLSVFHWVGMVLLRYNTVIQIVYLDSENRYATRGLITSLLGLLQQSHPEFYIAFKQIPVEQQRYTNCGPEVIENFIYYLTGARATQEAAVYVHSLLLENTLLDPMEYVLKISKNNKLIKFLSNKALLVDRPIEQNCYSNCGSEVIESFMLHLTGERLSQEEGIVYNSRLVEQELMVNAGNSGTEHFSKIVHGSYFMHILAGHREYVSEHKFVPEVRDTQSNNNQVIELQQEEKARLINSDTTTEELIVILSSKQEQTVNSDEVVITDHRNDDDKLYIRTAEYLYVTNRVADDKTELVDEVRLQQDTKIISNPIKQAREIVDSLQERTTSSSEAVTIYRENGNKLYIRATELAEEGWLAEGSKDENAALIAESRFAEAMQLYAEVISLYPTNIMYRQAFNIISLKIDGNSLFNEGVELVDIAYQLAEELLFKEKRNTQEYDIIISKYLDVINIYQAAHDKFTEGLRLSLDMRFKSCMELVKQSINNIQMAVEQLEDEKQGIEALVDDVVENSEDEPFIELFANNNEHGLMEGVLMGINHPVDYHLIM